MRVNVEDLLLIKHLRFQNTSYEIMTDSSSSEIELELYEEVINMKYSTPMASRASSPLSHDKNESSMTHFNGPHSTFQ